MVRRTTDTFTDYATAWLAAQTARKVTVGTYRSSMKHATTAFGTKPIAQVTRADVEAMTAALVANGRSQRTVALVLFLVRGVLDRAVEDGVVLRNVAAKVQSSGKPARKRSAFTAEDMTKLWRRLSTDPLAPCWLLTLLGLRRSELMGLCWSDIDLTKGTVQIERGRVLIDGHRTEVGPTKTRRGVRTLPLPPEVVSAFKEMRERHAAEFGFDHVRTGPVVVDPFGEPMRPERWSDLWRLNCRLAEVPEVTLYSARHSSVTLMRDRGVPDHDVAAWHGHDEVVMRQTYSHAGEKGLASAGAALVPTEERVLRAGPGRGRL